jgi:hypothetical protein
MIGELLEVERLRSLEDQARERGDWDLAELYSELRLVIGTGRLRAAAYALRSVRETGRYRP